MRAHTNLYFTFEEPCKISVPVWIFYFFVLIDIGGKISEIERNEFSRKVGLKMEWIDESSDFFKVNEGTYSLLLVYDSSYKLHVVDDTTEEK